MPKGVVTLADDVELEVLDRLARDDHHAAAGRLAPPQRAAHLDRLAGDHRGHGMALVHGVGVHDPRHHPLVGIHVGGRYVGIGAQRLDDAGGVPAGHPLQLGHRHGGGVADHSALGPAERQVRHRVLPCHGAREAHHLFYADIRDHPYAALARPPGRVVDDADSLHLGLLVVHFDDSLESVFVFSSHSTRPRW